MHVRCFHCSQALSAASMATLVSSAVIAGTRAITTCVAGSVRHASADQLHERFPLSPYCGYLTFNCEAGLALGLDPLAIDISKVPEQCWVRQELAGGLARTGSHGAGDELRPPSQALRDRSDKMESEARHARNSGTNADSDQARNRCLQGKKKNINTWFFLPRASMFAACKRLPVRLAFISWDPAHT